MTELHVVLFNFEGGGMTAHGRWDLARLRQAFAGVADPPHLILLNEAKEYGFWGQRGLFAAANELTELWGRPYEGRLGINTRGPMPPALFYDPHVIRLRSFGDTHPTVFEDRHNVADFTLRGNREPLRVVMEHLTPDCGDERLRWAKTAARLPQDVPTLIGGDLNSTASGPHLPRRDWYAEGITRRHQKGMLVDGVWMSDTRALDVLLGRWEASAGGRVGDREFHALAELAWKQGRDDAERAAATLPTINDNVDVGGGLLIDWLLVNTAWKDALVPGTYRVHVPPGEGRADYPSDHRVVEAVLEV